LFTWFGEQRKQSRREQLASTTRTKEDVVDGEGASTEHSSMSAEGATTANNSDGNDEDVESTDDEGDDWGEHDNDEGEELGEDGSDDIVELNSEGGKADRVRSTGCDSNDVARSLQEVFERRHL